MPKDIGKPTTISEEKFYEQLAVKMPAVVPRLKAFTKRLEAIGARIEFGKASMIIRFLRPDEKLWNVGLITTSGDVWTDALSGQADSVGLIKLSHTYLERLASVLPDAYVKRPHDLWGGMSPKETPASQSKTYSRTRTSGLPQSKNSHVPQTMR